jgi:hypothetical protein
MPLHEVYTLYSHIIKIQDSGQVFKFKNDCESLHSPSTPGPAITSLPLEQKEDTPPRGWQDDNLSDSAQLGLVVGINTDSIRLEDDGEKAPEAMSDVRGDDVEVIEEAGSNIMCVFKGCMLYSE